jgi:hypothetical protein
MSYMCKNCGTVIEEDDIDLCPQCSKMTTPTDPKARLVGIIGKWTQDCKLGTWPDGSYVNDLADRLLASAPVVPSVETLRGLLMKASSFGSVTADGCEAIRNHLLTLGYKDNSDLLAAQAEVTRLRGVLKLIAGNTSGEPNARQCASFAREALAPKEPS